MARDISSTEKSPQDFYVYLSLMCLHTWQHMADHINVHKLCRVWAHMGDHQSISGLWGQTSSQKASQAIINHLHSKTWMRITFYSPKHIIIIYIINASSTPTRFLFAERIKHHFTFIAKNQDKLVSAKAKKMVPQQHPRRDGFSAFQDH